MHPINFSTKLIAINCQMPVFSYLDRPEQNHFRRRVIEITMQSLHNHRYFLFYLPTTLLQHFFQRIYIFLVKHLSNAIPSHHSRGGATVASNFILKREHRLQSSSNGFANNLRIVSMNIVQLVLSSISTYSFTSNVVSCT